ncbi:MAG: thiamine diphosphokinase [Lachnospiraceae bacterium]|nr:thiamine diphosphokinase [Lachnospiraceae bacterium]
MRNAYIVAGGTFDFDAFSAFLKEEKEYPYIIAADRGFISLSNHKIKIDCIIGDFDSAGEKMIDKAKEICDNVIVLNPIKDDTDTEAALDVAMKEVDGDIYIFAGTGTRLDHIYSNIQILYKALLRKKCAYLIDAHNKIQLCDRNSSKIIIQSEQYGDYVSVFPMTETVHGITMSGFKYSLSDFDLSIGTSRGQSNEIVEPSAEISVKDGVLVVIEAKD